MVQKSVPIHSWMGWGTKVGVLDSTAPPPSPIPIPIPIPLVVLLCGRLFVTALEDVLKCALVNYP